MRVLILSSNNGGGHNAVAAALKESLENNGGVCRIEDCLSFLAPWLSRLIAWLHSFVYCRIPRFYGAAYRFTERHSAMFEKGRMARFLLGLGKRRLASVIREGNYDTVLCTHVFAAMMLADTVEQYRLTIKTGIVETDYTVSPGAAACDMDWHFVPSELQKRQLSALGVPANQIIVSGIPVRSEFYHTLRKDEAKKLLGILPEQRHLLMMCGSTGCGPLEELLLSLSGKADAWTYISVICGGNAALRDSLSEQYREQKNIRIYGRTEEVALLMDSADVYLTKPGGISISEAAAKGLPMVLIDAVSGCEAYNLEFFIRTGGAVSGQSVEELTEQCVLLLEDTQKRSAMSEALSLAVPGSSAKTVCAAMEAAPLTARVGESVLPAVDYSGFTFSRLGQPEYNHLNLLLFFPAYLLSFLLLERLSTETVYHPVHCTLDDWIPFNEWFLFPYLAWHVLIPLMVLYTLRHDVPAFNRLMWYFISTYCVTLAVYCLYPTCQELRPEVFPRDNLLTRAVGLSYWFDTSTNVCPSMHVSGVLGLWFTAKECRRFSTKGWRTVWGVSVILICLSTMFLKQQSVIDVIAALPVSLIGRFICCRTGETAHAGERVKLT